MGDDGNAHRDRETAEEEKEERNPLGVLEERPNDFLVSQPVFEKNERDRPGSDENDGGSQPDLETVHVKVVYRELESEKDIVDDTHRD